MEVKILIAVFSPPEFKQTIWALFGLVFSPQHASPWAYWQYNNGPEFWTAQLCSILCQDSCTFLLLLVIIGLTTFSDLTHSILLHIAMARVAFFFFFYVFTDEMESITGSSQLRFWDKYQSDCGLLTDWPASKEQLLVSNSSAAGMANATAASTQLCWIIILHFYTVLKTTFTQNLRAILGKV